MGFDDTTLNEYETQQGYPAAPKGLQQQAARQAGGGFGNTLDQIYGDQGYSGIASTWYTGQNTEGINNGWSTPFFAKLIKQNEELSANGGLNTQFDRPDATGVVLWDHTSTTLDTPREYHFGDVYEDGKFQGNVFKTFDQNTANMMMADIAFDRATKTDILSDSDPMARLQLELEKTRETNNVEIPKALKAMAFEGTVQQREDIFAEHGGEAAVTGLGAVGGAVTTGAAAAGGAAALGTPLGPVGIGAFAAGGFVVGGVGAWFNRDELLEQAARAYEVTSLSNREQSTLATVGVGLQQWGSVAASASMPLTQASHGLVELTSGTPGDRESAYYAVDDKGDPTRPLWAKPLSLGASVADGIMQFASPLNRGIYMAQMGTQVGGSVLSLAASGGEQFNPREGGFNNIFRDEQGNFDPGSGAAGVLNIGIDAVQMTGMWGLARSMGRQGAAAAAGARPLEAAGYRFLTNEAGAITGKRATISLLAPSEQITAWSVARKARVTAMEQGRVVTADDFYKAATSMAAGGSKLKMALVNGFGEGYEELAQGLLEPWSMDAAPSGVFDAFLQGAASGAGMSLGATLRRPTGDQRMEGQAYWLETLRRGGIEPSEAEWRAMWDGATDTQKRVWTSRSEGDVQLTATALQNLTRSKVAQLMATEPDVTKAINARLAIRDKALEKATRRTDAYHVIGGLVDALSQARPEAFEASALTVATLLEDRLRGLSLQADTIARLLEDATATPEIKASLVAMGRQVDLAKAVGERINSQVSRLLDGIYGEGVSESDAQRAMVEMNRLLVGYFDRTGDVGIIKGLENVDPAELRNAAALFSTMMHSREPKLDSGSYLALLPQASWELTRTRSDNTLNVNVDILQAINGDFDGDKLRSEFQLVLTTERFAQARAGQNYGGAGYSIDIATAVDAESIRALGTFLTYDGSQLAGEAEATMDRIFTKLRARYGKLMSQADMTAVEIQFTADVRAGNEEARVGLLNSLAEKASAKITELGRSELNNEWLWASSLVRGELQQFQRSYRQLRMAPKPTPVTSARSIDTPEGIQARKTRATTEAITLSLFATGNSLFRKFQKAHYSWYNSAARGTETAAYNDLLDAAMAYEELSRGVTQSELSRVTNNDTIGATVLAMLERLVDSALDDPKLAGKFTPTTAMSVLANVKMKDVWLDSDGVARTDHKPRSLVQILLKKALDADRELHARTWDTDEKLQARHAALSALTFPNDEKHPVNAERAFFEVFKSTPFLESLGSTTGALAPHTTPEQWLRNYVSLDDIGRRAMEREFTNVPEYLDRKEKSNLPYSMKEMERGEITPYRSMMDAMMAVGRAELTFEPNTDITNARRALRGRRAEVSHRATDDLIELHKLGREALQTMRNQSNRTSAKRKLTVELVQQMFTENPDFGRAVLETIPDAAVNMLYEYRDGQLWVDPWVYEFFTIDDSKKAAFHYWKNLTMAQWFSLNVDPNEDDSDAPGRQYNKLQSRFHRMLYELSREPGQMHMELLIRKLDEYKDIDQFFLWLNSTPGFRGKRAPLLPFYDDVAEFEADSGGGWTQSRNSTDLRQAISEATRQAETMRDAVNFRAEREATDAALRRSILRARDGSGNNNDLDNLRRFERAVQVSQELPRGFAPTAMLALTRGVLRGFDAHAHDKGTTIDYAKPLGEFQALMDGFGFLPALERTMESLTSHSLSSLKSNLGDLSRFGGKAMDATGREIVWERMTVDQALDMLDKAPALAYALLTPAALDVARDKMVERNVFDSSLKSLLDERNYTHLFNLQGDGAMNNAMVYLSMIGAYARSKGGHFDEVRYVNALAAARLTKLDRPATEDDLSRATNRAYLDLARALQELGGVFSDPDAQAAGVVDEIRKDAVTLLRDHRRQLSSPSILDDQGKVVDQLVTLMIKNLESDALAKSKELERQITDSSELTRRLEILDNQTKTSVDRFKLLLEDDLLSSVIARFQVTGDAARDQAARARILEYVTSTVDFGQRAPESLMLHRKIADLQLDGKVPGDDFDWDQLSRSAMGVYLTDALVRVGGHISIPDLPKGDPVTSFNRFYKYFDPSYSFIATDLLDMSSPLAEAARWFHAVAEQPVVTTNTDKVVGTLKRSILDTTDLGAWAPGVMSQIVEGHTRMDSAAAGPFIGGPGNGPKRQAAIAHATRRTAEQVPDRGLVTTAAFTGDKLDPTLSRFNVLAVTLPGATAEIEMPLAQLDNRYFAAVRIDGVDVPLDADNLGYQYHAEVGASGLRYISLERLQRVVKAHARRAGKPLAQLTIEIEFLHPDSRPAGEEWMNNVYFDGMSHSLLPDMSESLLATLWSDNGGQITTMTQKLLDSSKTGTLALPPFIRPDEVKAAEAESLWTLNHDLGALLRAKTQILLESDSSLPPEYYNALYKHLSLHHIVVGTVDGKPKAMTAEEVIAHYAATPDEPLPMENPKLVKLSSDVLRSMVGETGDQGVPRYFDEEYLVNPALIGNYSRITDEMLVRFGYGWTSEPGDLSDTPLRNVSAAKTLKVRSMLTDSERNARMERIIFLNNTSAKVRSSRSQKLPEGAAYRGFNGILAEALGMIKAETNYFDFMADGLPVGPRKIEEAPHTMRLLEAYRGRTDVNAQERGWRVVAEGAPDYPGGVLTVESLNEKRELWNQVVKGDIVLVDLATFDRPARSLEQQQKMLERTLSWLSNTGATVVLGSGNGGSELRFFGERLLQEMRYSSIQGSRHMYAPVEFSSQSQNERAYESTLTETRNILPFRQSVIAFAVDQLGSLDQGTMMVNPYTVKLKDRKAVNNLLPTSLYTNYNLLLDNNDDNGIYALALEHLRTITAPSAEYRKLLLEMGGQDPERVMSLSTALDRFHSKITSKSSLGLEVEDELMVGDILPFIHTNGRVILYRHGFAAPDPSDLPTLFAMGDGLNVALAKSKTDSFLNANSTATITSVENRAGYGRMVTMDIPLQMYGDKMQLEWNGLKLNMVPAIQEFASFLRVPVFPNGLTLDGLTDLRSARKKEANEGRVSGMRNALAFFQYDFTDDLVRFLFPGTDPADPTARVLTMTMLNRLQNRLDLKFDVADASSLSRAKVAIADTLTDFALEQEGIDPSWIDNFVNEDPSTQIATAVLIYLMTRNGHVDNVIRSGGFSHPLANTGAAKTKLVPGIFADLLAPAVGSPLHTELFKRFNDQLTLLDTGAGMYLNNDWTVTITDDSGSSLRVYLQFGEAHSAGDNPATDGQAYDPNAPAAVSAHNVMAASLSIGALTAHNRLKAAESYAKALRPKGVDPKTGVNGQDLWQMMTALPDEKVSRLAGWRREAAPETARRAAARDEIVGLFKELDQTDWSEPDQRRYREISADILNYLNLFGSQKTMVDSWVRSRLGRPYGLDENGVDLSLISGPDAIETANYIFTTIKKHELPVAGGNIPLIDIGHLTTMFQRNRNRDGGWAPNGATSWDDWVNTAFGSAWLMKDGDTETGLVAEPRFDSMYLLAVDGLMHGYQDATTETRDLPVSSDILLARQLMDPENHHMLVSIAEDENLLATDPTYFNTAQAQLEQLVAGDRIYAPGRRGADPSSAMGKQRRRIDRWRKEQDMPASRATTVRGVRGSGQTFLGHTTTTTALFRSALNLRVGLSLFNPVLIASAPVEALYRRSINTMANLAAGESTGRLGRIEARWWERIADTRIGAIAEALGTKPTFTLDELQKLDLLTHALSRVPAFKSLIYKELSFQYPVMGTVGTWEHRLEKFTRAGARMQDPTWGMPPRDLARIYVETVLRRIAADPLGENVYSAERFLAGIARDPEWLKKQDLETHNMAIAAISNIRSLKPSVLSLATREVIEPLAESGKPWRNAAGNMLKLLTVFQNFWSNSVINMTGLQGAADFAAFWFDGRKKSKLNRRFRAGLAGEPFVPEEDEYYDMSEVVEGLDLADSFIRGGITHTALFTFGMIAGSLGFWGEDDEEKRRRLAAQQQGAAFIHDPRSTENDIRNKDTIFLNWLPMGMDSWFRSDPTNPDSDSLAQMNWTMRYFLSPVMGFERFYQTGDFGDIIAGFKDGLGAHPIVQSQLWSDAVATANELHANAVDAQEQGDNVGAGHLMITAVGVLERMMFENAFVNTIYTGSDRYDRDPYALPARDSDRNLQGDVRGNPYETSGLQQYVDSDGNMKQSYVARDEAGATIRSFTENRFGMALLGSIFTGGFGGSDMFRWNMPVKVKKVQLMPDDQGSLTTDILAAWQGSNKLALDSKNPISMNLTEDEASQIIKRQYEAAGVWWDADEVEAQAKQMVAQQNMALLSQVNEATGREELTDDGRRAVIDGLRAGSTTLGTAALNGIYMTLPQRDKLRDDLGKDIVQEGVDLGLSKDQATWRMRRIMYGTNTLAGTPRLIDLIYSDQIPYSDTLEYNQLNTTYVIGWDGMPLATGFKRQNLLGAFGLQPMRGMISPEGTGLAMDQRGNAVDKVAGINTGMRALEARPAGWEVPSIEKITKDGLKDLLDAVEKLDFVPRSAYDKKGSGSGWVDFGGGGYGGYGGGGGGYSSGSGAYFQRLYALPRGVAPYGDNIPYINVSNPLLRRADVRRERVWSERGRLKQWQ